MGYLIEIETKEMQHASEYAEKALKYMGKVMQCISSWEDEAGMGEREGGYGNRYGERGGYGNRYSGNSMNGRYGMRGGMNYRDEEEWEDDEMNERRGVRGSGRGRRY